MFATYTYASRTVPNALDVFGASHATNSATINGSAADYRRGEYFHELVGVVNSATSVWQTVSVTNSGGGSTTGNVFVAKTAELFYYDEDGNLTIDGRWVLTWDAENRLVQMEIPLSKWLVFIRPSLAGFDCPLTKNAHKI